MHHAIQSLGTLSRLALAYDAWAPVGGGNVRGDDPPSWLDALANVASARITPSSSRKA